MAGNWPKGISENAMDELAPTSILRQERFKPALCGRGYCRGLQTAISDVHYPLHVTNLLTSTIETAVGG